MSRHLEIGLVTLVAACIGGNTHAVEAKSVVPPSRPVPWVIESADYEGTVADQIARLKATLTVRVLEDGELQIPLTSNSLTITRAELSRRASRAHLMPQPGVPGQYVLVVSKRGTYKVALECSTRLAQDSRYEGVSFGIPQATFSTLTLSIPKTSVELREADRLYVEQQPDGKSQGTRLEARLASAQQVDIRWLTKPTAPVAIEPIVYGEVATLVALEAQLARVQGIVDYRIAQGSINALTIRLPNGLQVLNVRGSGIEDWRLTEQAGANELRVTLGNALKDIAYRLVIEAEQPLPAEQTSYELPELTLVGAKQERGQVAVAAEGTLEVQAGHVESLSRIDVKELAETLRSASALPILMAFRYHHHPYRAQLHLTRHTDLPVLNAIAEQGELVTVVSLDGALMTRATYAIRANKRQFLGVRLPEGATLWSCLVDGRSTKPAEGTDGHLLVPLSGTAQSDAPVIVELVYFEQRGDLASFGRMGLQGPVLDVPTTIANWAVYAPSRMKWLRTSGNVERDHAPVTFVEEPMTAGSATVAAAGEIHKRNGGWTNPWAAVVRKAVTQRFASNADSLGSEFAYSEAHDQLEQARQETMPVLAASPRGSETALFESVAQQANESGIFPLKIRVPKAGSVHRFNRLMTADEPLELQTAFVTLPELTMPFAFLGLGLLVISSGGALAWRRLKI